MATKKPTGKKLRRIGAVAGAAISLLTLAGCSTNQQANGNDSQQPDTNYEQTLNDQQTQIDELKGLIEQMQGQLDQANQDIKDLNADNLATKKLLMNYINELSKKCEELSNRVANVENNQQELSQDVANLTSEFNSLKEVVNSLQNSNLENSEWLKSLETSINKLTIQISILNTFSAYNRIDIVNPAVQLITINSDMNGSYVENDGNRIAYYDTVNYRWYASGDDMVHSVPTRIQNYVLKELNDFDTVTALIDNSIYSLTSSENNNSATVYLDSNGIYRVSYSGDFYYGLSDQTQIYIAPSNKAEYEEAVEYATSKIDSYINYHNYLQVLDNTFDDANYLRMDVVQEGLDYGEGVAVVSSDRVGLSVGDDNSDFQSVVIVEDGMQKKVYTNEDGQLSTDAWEMDTDNNLKMLKESLSPEGLGLGGSFLISFNKQDQVYTLLTDYTNGTTIRTTIQVDENGKIQSMGMEQIYSSGETTTASYDITELNQTEFNQMFEEIKTKYENLYNQIYQGDLNI